VYRHIDVKSPPPPRADVYIGGPGGRGQDRAPLPPLAAASPRLFAKACVCLQGEISTALSPSCFLAALSCALAAPSSSLTSKYPRWRCLPSTLV
jgi:hypothetical protein